MVLNVRPGNYVLPSYSLTGDLISFLRCGLQYRYNIIGRLPTSNPVQLWFGQFIHGVLEEAYRYYLDSINKGKPDLPPWKHDQLDKIIDLIMDRLATQGLFPWNKTVKDTGIERARLAVNEMGPDLFPIIDQAEVRLRGTGNLPAIPKKYRFREADRYEISGIVDVITHLQFNDPRFKHNRIVQRIMQELPPNPPDGFEVIIDYKGMRRPPKIVSGTPLWDYYNWQIQTYAILKEQQMNSLPIVAGVLLYINELLPSRRDMTDYKKELKKGNTDIRPPTGSPDEREINNWKGKGAPPQLTYDFRLQRAMRVIQVDQNSKEAAQKEFAGVVQKIETCLGKELKTRDLFNSWEKNSSDKSTCTACDAKTFCPDSPEKGSPKLPMTKI